jgi:hypothetical protein
MPSTTKTREQNLATAANEYARKGSRPNFGAPVSASQITYYEAAIKSLRKKSPTAVALGFKSTESAKRALRPVAQGDKSASSLPVKTREFMTALSLKLTALHSADGKTNKTWPRKHAIVLHAILAEKPARTKRAPVVAPSTEVPATDAE